MARAGVSPLYNMCAAENGMFKTAGVAFMSGLCLLKSWSRKQEMDGKRRAEHAMVCHSHDPYSHQLLIGSSWLKP